MKRLIIMFGAPGSGKGLIGDQLVKNLNLFKIATGDILRQEVKNQTPLGLRIAADVVEGRLIDDEIVNPIIEQKLQLAGGDVLLDGYPRCFSQMAFLKKIAEKNFWVDCIYLNTPLDAIISRIGRRRICSDCGKTHLAEDGCCPECGGKSLIRPDDANIQNRVCDYLETTEPVLREELIFFCRRFINIDATDINSALDDALDHYRAF